jgi:TolA-binding protein
VAHGAVAAVALAVCTPLSVFAQAADPANSVTTQEAVLTGVFNDAMSAFQAGDYAGAAPKLESLIAQAGEGAQLESVYFTLGAAYYNLEQYAKAIETLKKYQQKYPQSARIVDATLFIGRASLVSKDFNGAAEQFAKLVNVPPLREQALFYGAVALRQAGRLDEAVLSIEALISPEIRNALGVKAAMMLAGLYGDKKQPEKANAIVARVLQKTDLVEDLARLNAMAVELGDDHLQAGRTVEALAVYRLVRSREDVVKFQADRVAALQKQLDQTLAAMRANPKEAVQFLDRISQIRTDIAEAKKLFEDAKQTPDFAPGLHLRMGRGFYDLGRRWESIVAYNDILDRHPEAKERETAMFGAMVDYAELNQPVSARKVGEQYLKEFPQGPNADTVGYLMGASALQADDPQGAETYFGRMLKERPASTFKEEMRFLLANAKFAQGKFEEAIKDYEQYRTEYPKGTHAEDVEYRMAVGLVFAGKYEAAIPALEKYLEQYPKGAFAPDARYRLALCFYAANQYDDVIKRCRDWEKDYGNDQQLGEVLALLGDCQKAKGDLDDAIGSHIRSFKAATTDEVLGYSLFEAQKGLQKNGDWERMSGMFEEFVKDHQEHPLVPMAMYWIGKAKAREGRVDEAKQFIADTIKKYIDDPKRDAVEQLLTQLAQLCAKKKRPVAAAETPAPALASGTVAAAVATPTPTPEPQADPGAELDTLLSDAGAKSETAKARVLYAKSEIARLQKKPDEADKLLAGIAQDFKPDDLSPMLLAQAGDVLLARGETETAAVLFQHLMDDYPKSDVVDFAYSGLGEIAFGKQDYQKALTLFTEAIEEVGANQKLKDVTVGQAKALLALGKLNEAQKTFEQVASVREWRGDATAFAVYSLGEIEFKRGRWAEANASFQRVFVAYQKFLPWVAKAYIKSGECFEKLGKKPEATRTYQEMLRNEKLAKFEETKTARKRLQEIGGGS